MSAVAYLGLSILNLRTFAEHQAHEAEGGRSVIVEASPVFGLLFLNNNLHYVHHEHPRVPWYDLPALYRSRKAEFLAANASYSFTGYGDMFRRYLFHRKTPVPHPYPAPRLGSCLTPPVPVASLPMYDWPEVEWAHDRLWAAVSERLAARGIAAPKALDRTRPFDEPWLDPGLVLSQTCGWPYATRLHGMVRLVATPVYDVPGCRGPVLFEHDRGPQGRAGAAAFRICRDRRLAFNTRDSLSGFVAAHVAVQQRGPR